jgi:ParB family chromosome partitioning protein
MPTAKKATRRKKKNAPEPRGLDAAELAQPAPPATLERLAASIREDGGSALAMYRDPLGGHWQVLAALPLGKVEPTPYQRDLSETHVARLASAIDRLDRFLDPVIAVRTEDGRYWTPNGHHRVSAL